MIYKEENVDTQKMMFHSFSGQNAKNTPLKWYKKIKFRLNLM